MRHFSIINVLAFLLFGIVACSEPQENKQVLNQEDYTKYLQVDAKDRIEEQKKEFVFWENKLDKAPNQYPYLLKMAAAQNDLFAQTGDINYLAQASRNLEQAKLMTQSKEVGILRALSKTYITQHRFGEALEVLLEAEKIGEGLVDTQKMLFDVYLELGNDALAETYLEKTGHQKGFDYLIRRSKWEDHKGNLNGAIMYMEFATQQAETFQNKALMQWSYTNVADFYGHAGRIKDSYTCYLKALAINPSDAYAKKGLAWIAYSHEHNPEAALNILEAISKQHQSPDYLLLKAEIAEYTGDMASKATYLNTYLSKIQAAEYGSMYNSYLATLLVEEKQNYTGAMEIAQQEINMRPTAQSYGLLAWALFNKGEIEEALMIVEKHVEDKSFEPELVYQMSEIFKANEYAGDKVLAFKKDLLESTYELGPLTHLKVLQL